MVDWSGSTALIVIDMQKGFDDDSFYGPRNNPECETNVAKLIEAWRSHKWPIVFVRHDSHDDMSPLGVGREGNAFKDEVSGKPDLLVVKPTHSAFLGKPDLHIRERLVAGPRFGGTGDATPEQPPVDQQRGYHNQQECGWCPVPQPGIQL